MAPPLLPIPDECPVCGGGPIRDEDGRGQAYPLNERLMPVLDLAWTVPMCRSCASVATTHDGERMLARGLRAALWREAKQRWGSPDTAMLEAALRQAQNTPSESPAQSDPWVEVARDLLEEAAHLGHVVHDREIADRASTFHTELTTLGPEDAAPFRLPALGHLPPPAST